MYGNKAVPSIPHCSLKKGTHMYRLNIALRILTLVICTFAFTSMAQGSDFTISDVTITGGKETTAAGTGSGTLGGGGMLLTGGSLTTINQGTLIFIISLLTNGMPLTGF